MGGSGNRIIKDDSGRQVIFSGGEKENGFLHPKRMSWFFQGLQGSYLQPPPAATAAPTGNPQDIRPFGGQDWRCLQASSAEPNLDFPSLPCSSAPPTQGGPFGDSQGPGVGRGSLPLSYVTQQEQRCVLSWFLGWAPPQRERFLQDLLSKAVPGKVCTLLEQLNTLQVRDRPPNIFECQLRLWSQWFETWSEEEQNTFLHALEEKDPAFVTHFYRLVAGTAGRD
ncbi:hypothetical protein GN956_G4812 [Arapaima gigas]